MTDEKKAQIIQEYISTPEGLADLSSRTIPSRCGGQDYDPDGTPFLSTSGTKNYLSTNLASVPNVTREELLTDEDALWRMWGDR